MSEIFPEFLNQELHEQTEQLFADTEYEPKELEYYFGDNLEYCPDNYRPLMVWERGLYAIDHSKDLDITISDRLVYVTFIDGSMGIERNVDIDVTNEQGETVDEYTMNMANGEITGMSSRPCTKNTQEFKKLLKIVEGI